MKLISSLLVFYSLLFIPPSQAQETALSNKVTIGKEKPDLQWFRDAKFGLFIHWGLYSKLAGTYKDKNYYGSGEWIMYQAKIPAEEYAEVAAGFNPVDFNADAWAQFAKDAGIRYMVITAKHHEGFSMYDSRVSDFNIVKASPYKKDPMKALSEATRKRGIKFGFYYSQFLDWHEKNGGGNTWDFDEQQKDYLRYYREKSVPQLKELLTNYGPLGIVWFDMPGGLTKTQTQQMIDSLRLLQPQALFSSRVGQGLGDYTDFGDSEVPASPIADAWESIYTHNDSWGYIRHDMNFKSPKEIIQLLANVASKGGNLMLNVGPDGQGNIPPYSLSYLTATGKWLSKFGESIYGTTAGLIPAQPWGVSTSKPGRLYLHVMQPPKNNLLLVPDVTANVTAVTQLDNHQTITWVKKGTDLIITLPALSDDRNTVFAVNYQGSLPVPGLSKPLIVSNQYPPIQLEAVYAKLSGNTALDHLTFSHYFGDWKHATCITQMKGKTDAATFTTRVTEPGDYKVYLEYSCPEESSGQEAVFEFDDQQYLFKTLRTSALDESKPVLFIKHCVATISITKAGLHTIAIHPANDGKELFKLKTVVFEAVE